MKCTLLQILFYYVISSCDVYVKNSYVRACVSLRGPLMLTRMLLFVSHSIKFPSDCLSRTNYLACFYISLYCYMHYD